MDPCLAKIKEANLSQIKKGNIYPAIQHAKDYLYYIVCDDKYARKIELDLFVEDIKAMRKAARKEKKND